MKNPIAHHEVKTSAALSGAAYFVATRAYGWEFDGDETVMFTGAVGALATTLLVGARRAFAWWVNRGVWS